MNDLERDLREMFTRREGDLRWPPPSPPGMAKRVLRRRAGRALVAGLTGVAVLAGSVLGYRALTDRQPTDVIGEDTPGFATAYVGGVSIHYPDAWHLTSFDEGVVSPYVVLTNFEMDPANDDPCSVMPAAGVAFMVAPDVFVLEIAPQPWPAEVDLEAPHRRCAGPDDRGSFWSTSVGRQFGGQAFVGPASSEDDRSRLVAAIASLTFYGVEDSVSGSGAVLASGLIDGRPWALFGGRGPSLSISTSQSGGGLSGGGLGADVDRPEDIALSAPVMHGDTYLFGGVPAEAVRVRVSPDGIDPFDVSLLDVPATTSFRAFVTVLPGARRGTVATHDDSGSVLAEVHFSPGES